MASKLGNHNILVWHYNITTLYRGQQVRKSQRTGMAFRVSHVGRSHVHVQQLAQNT